ncbi:MAG: hypothetical protein Q9N68_02075 [Gammaproteobacteria bacterium]|nr:hypothetical protein [Gammaproteobacteria bacterium]
MANSIKIMMPPNAVGSNSSEKNSASESSYYRVLGLWGINIRMVQNSLATKT